MKIDYATQLLQSKEGTFLTAIAVCDEYVPSQAVPILGKYAPNQPLIYRHNHPSNDGEMLGTIVSADAVEVDVKGVKKQGFTIKAQMLEYTDYQKKALEYIKLKQDAGDPIKISVGYQEFKQGGKFVDARPFEFSLTRIPVCEECSATEVVTMEKDEAKIKELEALLDKALTENKTLEAKLKDIEAKEGSVSKKFEDSIKTAVETVKKEYDGQIKVINEQLETAKTELKKAKYDPIMASLFALEKDEELLSWYQSQPIEKLQARLERKKKDTPPQIVTKTMEESRKEASEQSQKAEITAKIRKSIAADPELGKYIGA